ncbi:hypothetical protein CEXT_252571 [Caerostris extrusa]|uniref:Uncharacterized protein n=1 Tax=Caerostris extrusa TaxID=172846 RepID=A0AAV4MW75_CAEEX|nr:hypothetical protein CEXT_252571 [Caerostris extrusa]
MPKSEEEDIHFTSKILVFLPNLNLLKAYTHRKQKGKKCCLIFSRSCIERIIACWREVGEIILYPARGFYGGEDKRDHLLSLPFACEAATHRNQQQLLEQASYTATTGLRTDDLFIRDQKRENNLKALLLGDITGATV